MSMPPMLHDFHIKNTSKAVIEITLEKSHINAAIVGACPEGGLRGLQPPSAPKYLRFSDQEL